MSLPGVEVLHFEFLIKVVFGSDRLDVEKGDRIEIVGRNCDGESIVLGISRESDRVTSGLGDSLFVVETDKIERLGFVEDADPETGVPISNELVV